MPEGDSVRIAAERVAPVLVGERIDSAASRWPSAAFGLVGCTVTAVEVVGKHLVLALDDGSSVRIHLGMRGRWRVLPPGAPTPGSLGNVALRLDTARGAALCTGAPTVERFRSRERAVHPALAALGPDVLADDFDPGRAAARVVASPADTAVDVLRDQHVACGVGNVYACEVLFVRRVWPFAAPASLDIEGWTAIYAAARTLMLPNVGPGHRRTTPRHAPAPHYVYDRARRGCLRCGTPIASRYAGSDDRARTTYWCPRCQPAPAAAPEGTG